MSLCPSTVASSGQPLDLYFPLVENLPPAQVLSQAGNTVSLSGGGGSVNVASTTSVATSAQKTTAITYDTGLLETNVAGVLNVGLGSAIGSTRIEGGNVVISRTDAAPAIEFTSGVNTATIDYNATGSIFGEPSLIASVNELGMSTGIVEGVSMGFNSALQTAYVSGKGLPLFIGESGANSYSGIVLGNANAPTNALFIDRKDDTDVTQSAATVVLTGTGLINIESQLATGGIGISTLAAADININSGQDITMTAAGDDFNLNGSTTGSALLNVGGGMIMTSDAAKAEFKNAAGVLKGSMGYNVGTDYMDLTGSAGFEINTTAGDLNMQANGGKINMITNGNNIELFGNTTGGFFADVNIGSSDGDLDMAIGGNITMNAGTSGGNITVTAFGDFSVSSTTVKLPTLPTASTANQLFYDTSTKGVSYGPAFPAIAVQAATGTIALTEAMNRATYILTGTSATQSFSQAGLVGVAAGWTVYLRNGNNATGLTQDITISIPAGNTTLHAPTGVTNSSFILLYWNGSALVAYR